MRAVSNSPVYSTPLSVLGAGTNGSPQQQPAPGFENSAVPDNTIKRNVRGAVLRGTSTLDPEMLSTLLQTQEILESEVSRFLNARRKISGLLKTMVDSFEGEEEHSTLSHGLAGGASNSAKEQKSL